MGESRRIADSWSRHWGPLHALLSRTLKYGLGCGTDLTIFIVQGFFQSHNRILIQVMQ